MRKTNTLTAICAFSIICQILSCGTASAFRSSNLFGGAIHRAILYDALTPLGVSGKSLYTIGKGTDSQDVPFSKKFSSSPQNHCDDGMITAGRDYFRGRLQQAVIDAKEADKNATSCRRALYEFGEGMHTVQDFYSHANYLEWLLRSGKTLEPVDWGHPPAEIVTGYYYYKSFLKQEIFVKRSQAVRSLLDTDQHLQFHSDDQYNERKKHGTYDNALAYAFSQGDFLHGELNKDSPTTMEGRIVAPQYNKTFHQLARALATADTARQWKTFEQSIKERYGQDAPRIIAALKGKKRFSRAE